MNSTLTDAYEKGYIARQDGMGTESNPYSIKSVEYHEWQIGWYDSDAELFEE